MDFSPLVRFARGVRCGRMSGIHLLGYLLTSRFIVSSAPRLSLQRAGKLHVREICIKITSSEENKFSDIARFMGNLQTTKLSRDITPHWVKTCRKPYTRAMLIKFSLIECTGWIPFLSKD